MTMVKSIVLIIAAIAFVIILFADNDMSSLDQTQWLAIMIWNLITVVWMDITDNINKS